MKCKPNRLWPLTACLCLLPQPSRAVTFDTSLLAGASRESDLSRFYEDNDMPAGNQEMDIYVNGDWQGRFTVTFGKAKDDIYLDRTSAALLGINMSQLNLVDQDGVQLKKLVQGGRVAVDPGTLSIQLTVPQSFMLHHEQGYVDPRLWDRGIPALMLSYNTTYYNTRSKTGDQASNDDLYAGLDSGLNLLGWQFRDSSTWSKHSGESSQWQNNTRYLRRPIPALKSNLMMGDFYTPGDLFDSLRVRGVFLGSDINMRPNSQQGFSPVVHGVARTNALVKVMQSGNVIWQENVPPGAFTLDDIQPTGSAGDLLVVVREADGSQQSFSVPFSAVPGMLKQGISQYSLVVGKVHQTNTDYQPGFMQGTLRHGFNNLVAGYAGSILSENYTSGLLGAGWNLPVGAVSVDVTHARTQLQHRSDSGQSFRIAYSKFVSTTATNFTLAAYRYSTNGYYSFSDAIYSRDGYHRLEKAFDNMKDVYGFSPDIDLNTWDALRSARPKNTFNLDLNQQLGKGWGTAFISVTQRDYWSKAQKSREYQMGYSNSFDQASYTLSASRVRNSDRQQETRMYVSLSLPFSIFDSSAWLTSSVSAADSHYQQTNLSLSGNAMDSNRLSYSLSGSNQHGGSNTAGASTAYRSDISTIGGSWSESSDYRQTGLSSRGSIVAIPGHVLMSNEVGRTMTIVEAPGAKGMMVNGDDSIVTNRDGLALVPYATAYRRNAITLSSTRDSVGADVVGNIANTAPWDGAVSYLRFETDRRTSWELNALQASGKPLPFGTEVFNDDGESVGFVGQNSVLYIRSEHQPRGLNVKLRDGSCRLITPTYGMNAAPTRCR